MTPYRIAAPRVPEPKGKVRWKRHQWARLGLGFAVVLCVGNMPMPLGLLDGNFLFLLLWFSFFLIIAGGTLFCILMCEMTYDER